ncbi:MAG: S24/S26 family peptidase [Bacteroidaceae bacterium]|nr:S24/S26 family peptidase [Bacteroidaceae bacterium]
MSIQERKGIRVNNHLFMEEIRRMFNEKGKSSVTFVVRGYSMRPFVEHERDKVILVPPRTPKVGDVVLAEIAAKRYALHRVIKIKDGIYTMQGDGNPTSLVEHFTEEKIVGIAHAFIRKGKVVPLTSRKWRIYSTVWRVLKPMRRLLLAVYRRLK